MDSGHSIRFNKNFYRTVNTNGIPIYFGKGTKCMVIESFNKQLYATVGNNIFALEKIPETQAYSVNFDEILPTKKKNIYIPNMIHPWRIKSFESFYEKRFKQSNYINK